MRRHLTVLAGFAALALAAPVALLLASSTTAEPTKSQQLFRKTLLDDAKTTSAIKRLLRDEGGFVAPEIEFTDVTGDDRSDAVVLVDTGGAAGAVALYVFSTHGKAADSALRAVYRSQRLYRASASVSGELLILHTPRFVEGDDLCCPAKVVERVYAWSRGERTLEQRSTQELPGPAGGTTTTPE
ncbi:MAG TPA: hypothetical protein VGO80_16215 [Solirubrobacteraceae bacterium]|jgi:hypothetical protein|nr:hypothetical protein [Solirubrobacteraceae bacterium]